MKRIFTLTTLVLFFAIIYHKSNVGGYSVCASAENNKLSTPCISSYVDYLKTNSISNTLTLDTLWLQ
jgi:Na+-transporting NADH:ubiquinone oxidoreductase subunit NqrB